MNNIKVSIVMPAFNSSKYIRQTIDSVLGQTFDNFELIIVDDGSVDDTANIVSEYTSRDSRVKYFYQKNRKQAAARNYGVSLAVGTYIAFIDSDDLWVKNKLSLMVEAFESGEQDLLFSGCYIFSEDFDEDKFQYYDSMRVVEATYHGFSGVRSFLEYNRVPMSTVLVRRQIFSELSFDEVYVPAEDYHLWLRMLLSGYKLRSLPDPLVAYRMHDSSSSAQDRGVTDVVIQIVSALRGMSEDKKIKKLFSSHLNSHLTRRLSRVSDFKGVDEFSKECTSLGVNSYLFNFFFINNFVLYGLFRLNRKLIAKAATIILLL